LKEELATQLDTLESGMWLFEDADDVTFKIIKNKHWFAN